MNCPESTIPKYHEWTDDGLEIDITRAAEGGVAKIYLPISLLRKEMETSNELPKV